MVPQRGVTSLPTKSPEHAAEDLPEPAKRERSAKAQAEQHSPLTGEKRVPEAAAVVNAPEAASPGIAIVSPRADGGPTSPGLMTQVGSPLAPVLISTVISILFLFPDHGRISEMVYQVMTELQT